MTEHEVLQFVVGITVFTTILTGTTILIYGMRAISKHYEQLRKELGLNET